MMNSLKIIEEICSFAKSGGRNNKFQHVNIFFLFFVNKLIKKYFYFDIF